MIKRHPGNSAGNWYVDTSCTDCSASRTVAPGLIVERDGQSVFARQPKTAEELRMAWRARLLCPTASIHTERKETVPEGVFPEQLTEGVYRLGYNAANAAGAHSFLAHGKAGNFMIDSPRWTRAVVDVITQRGGLKAVLLTHRDDIGDAKRYAAHFGAAVWIHHADRDRAPFADHLIEGTAPAVISEDMLAIPVPGHTRGSVVYLFDERCLFTGDSLAWSFEGDDLMAWREFCWYSWAEQIKSLRRLFDYTFEWVCAGHGGSKGLPSAEMNRRLRAMIRRLETDEIRF
jgi:glyoxylase-like metal-dependent hydrolase (beta-lactamase superfamily II)